MSSTVTLKNRPDGDAAESLDADVGTTDIAKSYDSSTGVLTLTGVASKADYEQVLQTVEYDNTASPPDATSRTVEFTVNDGDVDSAVATATVTVVAPPSQLAVDLDPDDSEGNSPDFAATHEQGHGVTPLQDTDASITYSGGTTLTRMRIVIGGVGNGATESLYICDTPLPLLPDDPNGFGGGLLICPDPLGSLGFSTFASDNGDDTLTIDITADSGAEAVSDWQDVLRTLAFEVSDTSPTLDDRTFAITVHDDDNSVSSNPVTSTIDVIENQTPNQLPTAVDDVVSSWNEDGGTRYFNASSAPWTLAALLSNDSDPDNDLPLTIIGVGNAVGGQVFKNTVGTQPATEIQFLPTNHYHGPASFEYTVSDNRGGTDTAMVSFTINSVPDNPFPVADRLASVEQDCVDVVIDDSTLLANDFDSDNQPPSNQDLYISAIGTGAQVGGTATANSASPVSGVTFDCAPGFTGDASFVYKIKDASGAESGFSTVTIPVTQR